MKTKLTLINHKPRNTNYESNDFNGNLNLNNKIYLITYKNLKSIKNDTKIMLNLNSNKIHPHSNDIKPR